MSVGDFVRLEDEIVYIESISGNGCTRYVCVFVRTYINVYVYVRTVYVRTYVYRGVCVRTYIGVHVCTYIYRCVCTYVRV
jgi:hypothetical protein